LEATSCEAESLSKRAHISRLFLAEEEHLFLAEEEHLSVAAVFESGSATGEVKLRRRQMNGLIYLIGLIVVILAILSFFGLR
jgi:hypothetical protein